MTDQAQLLRQVRLALEDENLTAAIDALKQVATLARQQGDRAAEGRHLGNLALLYYRAGRPEQALQYFERALASARSDGDHATESGLLGNMGNILRELGRYEEAIRYLNEALMLAQQIGDLRGRGIWLGNLGLVYDDLRNTRQAVELHTQSVGVARALHDQRGLVTRLSNLGNSQAAGGDVEGALRSYAEVEAISRQMGTMHATAHVIGDLYAQLARGSQGETARGYFEQALRYYGERLNLAYEDGDEVRQGLMLYRIGGVLYEMGDADGALRHLRAARDIFTDLRMPGEAARAREGIEAIEGRET
jgi:tetratricopeptide (TPR) repeat protein